MKCPKDRPSGLLIGAILLLVQVTMAQAAPQILSVSDTGAYTKVTSELNASWTVSDPATEVQGYQYRLKRQSVTGTVIKGWTSVGMAVQVRVTGLKLTTGESYFFEVRAVTGRNRYSPSVHSDGIMADAAVPMINAVVDDGNFTAGASALHAVWYGGDVGSGIQGYRYAIGTTSGATNVRGWTSAGTATEITASGLALASGTTYFVSIEATDRAGNVAVKSSDGIMVDALPPTILNVSDSGAFTSAQSALTASWAATDAHSGLSSYSVSVGTAPGAANVKPWTSVGAVTSMTLSGLTLQEGIPYFVNVTARDLMGNTATASSDGIVADWTGPVVTVSDSGAYTVASDRLSASWSGADAIAGVSEYQYAIGTQGNHEALVPWTTVGSATGVTATGLALSDLGTYFVSVKATDAAGNVGIATSDGITADLLAPPLAAVIDEGSYKTGSGALSASWIVGPPARSPSPPAASPSAPARGRATPIPGPRSASTPASHWPVCRSPMAPPTTSR